MRHDDRALGDRQWRQGGVRAMSSTRLADGRASDDLSKPLGQTRIFGALAQPALGKISNRVSLPSAHRLSSLLFLSACRSVMHEANRLLRTRPDGGCAASRLLRYLLEAASQHSPLSAYRPISQVASAFHGPYHFMRGAPAPALPSTEVVTPSTSRSEPRRSQPVAP